MKTGLQLHRNRQLLMPTPPTLLMPWMPKLLEAAVVASQPSLKQCCRHQT